MNVANAKSGSGDGGLGVIGEDQLEWLKKDVDGLKDSTPVVVFAHVPLWTVYEKWGWGTRDAEQALKTLKRFGSLTVLNGHIHQVLQKVEGKVTFHTARSTAFPQSEPGKGSPGPIRNLPAEKLKAALGLSAVSSCGESRLTRHRGFHARMTNRTARSKRNSPQRFLSTFHGTGGTCSRRRSCNTYLPREDRCAMKKMKKWWLAAAVSLAVFAGFGAGIAKAQPSPPVRDIGGEVRGVFATRCAGCHGPDLAKPKGQFGYVLNLRRIAANPEMVIPGRPTESELWILVQGDEMPPTDSPQGALTPVQKEVIRAWIVAGAPNASPGALDSPPSVRSGPTTPAPIEMAPADRFIHWLGKFHLLLLHFPIALVLAAGVGETRSVWQRNPIPSESVRFCLWLAQLTHPHFQVGMSTGKATGKATHQRLGQKGAAHVGQMVADRTPNSAHTNASVTRLTL